MVAAVTHQTAQQKAKARNANPLGGKPAQLAPSHPVTPVVCAECGHLRLRHFNDSQCWVEDCGCVSYEDEASNV